jgi:transposase-like protein
VPRHPNYSREFKEAIVSKIVNRGNQTVAQVCEAEGIGKATATNWLRNATMPAMNKKTKSKKWSAKEKLRAVGETLSASETEIGTFLRREGLHSQQLQEWQEQALSSLESTTKSSPSREEFEALAKQIKELERELLRKDKALAEASALLILQKKINLIWGDGDPK